MNNSKTALSHLTDEEILSYARQNSDELTDTYLEIELRDRLERRLDYVDPAELKEEVYLELGMDEEDVVKLVEACNAGTEDALATLQLLPQYGYASSEELRADLELLVRLRDFFNGKKANTRSKKK
jgi:hypothetical protein